MSIHHSIRMIQRIEHIACELQKKYAHHHDASLELEKMLPTLQALSAYLSSLPEPKPLNYTSEINKHIEAINLHLDILKELLDKKDYAQLLNGMKALKTMLKFHPTKYSSLSYAAAWLLELIYFI